MSWRKAVAVAATVLVIAPFARAVQNDDDAKRKIEDLNQKVDALIKSNAELTQQVQSLKQVQSRGPSTEDLDRAIADLAAKIDQAPGAKSAGMNVSAPNVRSVKITFEDRFRMSQYFNPTFGAQKTGAGIIVNNNGPVGAVPGPANGTHVPADYFAALNRIRINLDVDINDKLAAFFQLQSSRSWGGNSLNNSTGNGGVLADQPTTTFTAAVPNDTSDQGIHQGYILMKDIFDSGGNLTVGRMALNLGHERLLSSAEWDNVGRSFDGFRGDYATNDISFTAVVASVVEGGLDFHNSDTTLFGAWAAVHPTSEVTITPYTLYLLNANNASPTPNTPVGSPWTIGVLADVNVEAVKVGGEFAIQQDEDRPKTPAGNANKSNEQVSFGEAVAFEVHAELAIPDSDEFKPKIGGEFGQGNKFFNDMYSSRHGIYGLGDFVTSWTNLQYFKLYGGATVSKDIDLGAAFYFFHQYSNEGLATNLSQNIGNELDVWTNIRCSDHLTTMIGWSHFFTGSSFQDGALTPGAWYGTKLSNSSQERSDADVLFVQATFKF